MPGLLQTPEGRFRSAKFVYALLAEAVGVLLFTFAATASVSPQQTAPWPRGESYVGDLTHLCFQFQIGRCDAHVYACRGNGIALALSGIYLTVLD